ncbi:3-deoxy-manno-octulosonate cytidylyltransferase [Adhaeribacter sp. BT258]|uniref:3-deoxy-manno-octulosonate cytidylyltransferase n=1 Tax=Adhaeribacter terrigena TaxID=2793070 RepID=A0ABS1BZG4_9BACT|nr:3-deoxy-manno-octulosonate cytidylyltransferase [Adhaeribacter terrigena]MBK0402519.1 3-deoxy-manno-octulosonate cytidylyltransferase [Adhaeribacter terrigena]
MSILGIIPARYASTRFPGKPLVEIGGKSMIRRVYEQAQKARLQKVVVATDDARIFEHVQSFGGNVVMTSENHESGTDRCFEAYRKNDEEFQYVINIQGDEPFIQPEQINLLADLLQDNSVQLATLIKKIHTTEELSNPNLPKVVTDIHGQALLFSRQTIPFLRNVPPHDWLLHHTFYKHIGIYGYRTDILEQITQLPMGKLEKAESLEQLRWLENGYKIRTAVTEIENLGIDTPEDLEKALRFL